MSEQATVSRAEHDAALRRIEKLEQAVSSISNMLVADECGGGQIHLTKGNAVLVINDLKR